MLSPRPELTQSWMMNPGAASVLCPLLVLQFLHSGVKGWWTESDCTDGTAQAKTVCASPPCSLFYCAWEGCVSGAVKCDGVEDCVDGSDETSATCWNNTCSDSTGFQCSYGACVSRYDVCDGAMHCQDGSDEAPENCPKRLTLRRRRVCPKRTKRYCDNRRECYDKRDQCDGKFDCSDRSDEKEEVCLRAPAAAAADCPPPACRCLLPGLEHVCLPCNEIADLNATCHSLGRADVCSVHGERGVAIDVLSCGAGNEQSCSSQNKMVPVMTVALADCWGTATLVMRCHSDGYWRALGAPVPDGLDPTADYKTTQPMKNLCQPFYMNSNVCGSRPRYKSTGRTVFLNSFPKPENRWPMVMGVKRREAYECSATLITPLFLLTAAHCVISSQESQNMTVDVRDLKVQLTDVERNDQFVAKIYLHPEYVPGQKPMNDLAIIRLDNPLPFNDKLYPACVDLDGYGFIAKSALTFSRAYGQQRHEYEQIVQQVDESCRYSTFRCRTLQIEDTQFCGVDIANKRRLVGGSSGGPFMQDLDPDQSEAWAISGVVSFLTEQEGCDNAHTVFTDISAFATWITDIVHGEL